MFLVDIENENYCKKNYNTIKPHLHAPHRHIVTFSSVGGFPLDPSVPLYR